MATAQEVLGFWFGECEPAQWFAVDEVFDRRIAERFGSAVEAALAAAAEPETQSRWTETARERLAAILLLDQFPRNIHRGAARAYAGDAAALRLALGAEPAGHLAGLTLEERKFMLMPLQHSEDLAAQTASLALFERHCDAETLGYAQRHHDVVARFGRFPHRNAALGRASTPEEIAFLAEHGAGF